MLDWKQQPLKLLKAAGYNQKDLFNGSTLWKLRHCQTDISLATLEKICELLNCQPGDLLEYIPDEE